MTLPAQTRPSRLLHWAQENAEDALVAFKRGDEEEALYRLQDAVHSLERYWEAKTNAA